MVPGMVLLLAACAPPEVAGELVVRGRWVRSEAGETWAEARAGMEWAFSNLGALPPADGAARTVSREDADGVRFELDLGRLGFDPARHALLAEAVAPLREDDEAAVYGGVDAGRVLLALVYEPWLYYAVTGACPTFEGWEADRAEGVDWADYAVVDSLLTSTDRHVQLVPPAGEVSALVLRAWDGSGDLLAGGFVAAEVDVVDVMANGQQRFAVYGEDGALRVGADPAVSPAGPPGRCQWCHEGALQRGVAQPAGPEGWLDSAGFWAMLDTWEATLGEHRAGLDTSLDFETYLVHEWGERLAEAWLAPPVDRLAREWALSPGEVAAALEAAGVEPGENPEYPGFGPVVARADAERVFVDLLPALARRPEHPAFGWEGDWAPVPVPASAREVVDEAALRVFPVACGG